MTARAFVYRVVHLATGRCYVGKTTNLAKRRRDHLWVAARKGDPHHRYLHAAIAKYGREAFAFETVEACASEADALAREVHWIAHYRATERACGFNLHAGGRGGTGVSAETRAKLRAANLGRKFSDASKAKMRAAKLGVPLAAAARAKITGRPVPPEQLAKRLGRVASDATRAKKRAAMLGFKHAPETIAKMRAHERTPEHAAKLTGRTRSAETREKMRAAWVRRRQRSEGTG